MATVNTLTALGIPAEAARRIGLTLLSVTTGAGTPGQGAGGGVLRGPGNKLVQVTATASNDGTTLSVQDEIGDQTEIQNVSGANATKVYPPSGGTLNQGTANQSIAVAANASLVCTKVSATKWLCRPAGASSPA